MTQLELSGITVRFGGHTALNNVDITVSTGSITGLIGPNGAGKTTLFNVTNGLLRPNEGTLKFGDADMTALSPYRRAKLGLGRTFQRLELFPSLTVRENVQVAAEIRGEWSSGSKNSANIKKNVDRALEITNLRDSGSKNVSEIPTGKARLVELARSLVQEPKLLLLDEPASGQNDNETSEFADILRSLNNEGMSIFLVEHDMSLVMNVCDKIFVLDFGSLIAEGTTEEIQGNPVVIDAYLGGKSE
jgi:branched-chain amino acid transport system ATP-binding protein